MNRPMFYIFACSLLLTGCREKDASGSYLFEDKGNLMFLQLVETPDHRLSGQLIRSEIQPDGKVGHASAPLTGAVDGENITLECKGLFGVSRSVSGTFDGDSITLTGADAPPGTMKRASISAYQARLAEQERGAQEIRVAKDAAELRQQQLHRQEATLAEMNEVADHMERFLSEIDSRLNLLTLAEKRYETVTAKMRDDISRERNLVGPRYQQARMQLGNEALQASLATDQILYSVEPMGRTLNSNITPLVSKSSVLLAQCREDDSASVRITEANQCRRLATVSPQFQQKYDATVAALSREDATYKQEKAKQKNLLAEAQELASH